MVYSKKNVPVERTSQSYNYFNLKSIQSDLRLEFESLKELIRYFQSQNVRTVYRIRESEDNVQGFGIPSKGGFLYHESNGFRSLEDYQCAEKAGFPDSHTFYLAKGAGFLQYPDFESAKRSGISEKSQFDALVSSGYLDGFAIFQAAETEKRWLWIPSGIGNTIQLSDHSKSAGFQNFSELEESFRRGYKNKKELDLANELGFQDAEDQAEALSRGFADGAAFEFAIENQLKDAQDAVRFRELRVFGDDSLKYDARLLLRFLHQMKFGRRISINKIQESLEKEVETFVDPDTLQLMPWFTRQFSGQKSDLEMFLNSHQVKMYGLYDQDGEFFESVRLHDRKVVIDGSNVALTSRAANNKKARVSNLLLVVEALKKLGIADITIIADASLRHRLTDKELLPELDAACQYLESPAETPADVFLIEMVKNEHCLLLTNDTFREWKIQDAWTAENIDFYRIAFLIEGKNVLLPGLARHISSE